MDETLKAYGLDYGYSARDQQDAFARACIQFFRKPICDFSEKQIRENEKMKEQDEQFIKNLGDKLEQQIRTSIDIFKTTKAAAHTMQGVVDKHRGDLDKKIIEHTLRLDQHRDTINENFATTDKRLNAHRDRIKADSIRTNKRLEILEMVAEESKKIIDDNFDELEEVVDRNETDIEYVSEKVRKIEKKLDAWKPLLDERKNYFFDEISAIKRAVNAINLRQQAPLIVVDTDSSGALSDDVPSTNAPTPVEKRYFVYQDVMTPGIKRFYVMDSRKKWPAIHKSKTNNRAVAECICKIMNEAEHYHRESGNDIYFGRQNNEESTQYILLEIQKTSPMVFPIRYESVMKFDVSCFTEDEIEEIHAVINTKTER